jgi:hypothetical protein
MIDHAEWQQGIAGLTPPHVAVIGQGADQRALLLAYGEPAPRRALVVTHRRLGAGAPLAPVTGSTVVVPTAVTPVPLAGCFVACRGHAEAWAGAWRVAQLEGWPLPQQGADGVTGMVWCPGGEAPEAPAVTLLRHTGLAPELPCAHAALVVDDEGPAAAWAYAFALARIAQQERVVADPVAAVDWVPWREALSVVWCDPDLTTARLAALLAWATAAVDLPGQRLLLVDAALLTEDAVAAVIDDALRTGRKVALSVVLMANQGLTPAVQARLPHLAGLLLTERVPPLDLDLAWGDLLDLPTTALRWGADGVVPTQVSVTVARWGSQRARGFLAALAQHRDGPALELVGPTAERGLWLDLVQQERVTWATAATGPDLDRCLQLPPVGPGWWIDQHRHVHALAPWFEPQQLQRVAQVLP